MKLFRSARRSRVRPADICPPTGDEAALLDRVAHYTGRPVVVVRRPIGSGRTSGFTDALADQDVIVIDSARSTPERQRQTLCHEVAHILLHRSSVRTETPPFDEAFPLLGERHRLYRCGAGSPGQEREAELFGQQLARQMCAAKMHVANKFS